MIFDKSIDMVSYNIEFPYARFAHCHNVGLRMYKYAKEYWHWEEDKCREMYILGLLHDIGYEFSCEQEPHDICISDILNNCGYKYCEELKYHSRIQSEYDSPEMKLLYYGDATVDGQGNWCTYEERVADIGKRHGKMSIEYLEAKEMAGKCAEWGFDDLADLRN